MRNKVSTLALLALFLSIVALGVALSGLTTPADTKSQIKTETAYERVMRTRTLRCAYFSWRPFFLKDPNTGVISGFVPDILAKIGEGLNVKIDYVEEVNIAQMFEGFKTGRYDAVCGPVTGNINRTAVSDFVKPVGYASIDVYVRKDDARFEGGIDAIDKPETKIAVIEGEVGASTVPLKFPNAKLVTLSNVSDNTQLLMELALGKADLVMADTASAMLFMANNPDKIRKLEGIPPVLLSGTFAIPPSEFALKAMLDNSVDYLVGTGYISALARKHGLQKMFFVPSIPHEEIK